MPTHGESSPGPDFDHQRGVTAPYREMLSSSRPYAEASGEYRLCMKLASGSTATIYLAMYRGTDGLQRPVVIKRIHPYLANRLEFVEMFFDEAQFAASVGHPTVCALYDFGRTKDTYFLAMEYIIGETFEQLTKQLRGITGNEVARVPHFIARLGIEVCEGLHAVHRASDTSGNSLGIVHRDITPRNLFALYDGTVRITDFGSARSAERQQQFGASIGKGKVAYMSPEQLAHQPLDARSDVWSMGVVLWELLTQKPMFSADNVANTVRAVQGRRVVPPSTLNPSVPVALDAIVMKAVSRDRNARHESARAMASELERFLADRNDPIGAPELTDWMERLFAGEAERRREIVRIARSMVEAAHAAPPPLQRVPKADPKAALGALAAGSSNDNARTGITGPVKSKRWWVFGLAFALVFVVFALIAFLLGPRATSQVPSPETSAARETKS